MAGKRNILILGSGPAILLKDLVEDKAYWMSKVFNVTVITSVSRVEFLKVINLHNFEYYPFLYYHGNCVIRNIKSFFLTIYKAIKIYYSKKKFNVIISPNPLITGFAALFIAKITSAKVIIEVNGNFSKAFKYGSKGKRAGISEKIKNRLSTFLIMIVLKYADGVKLLYQNQMVGLYDVTRIKTVACFHDFTPISQFTPDKEDRKYILFLGYPWLLKGVDVLIQSFNKIHTHYPEYKLKVVGWCPEGKEYFQKLSDDNPQIELCDPVFYNDVINLVNHCTILVLPSRTEAMGRSLLEAMAAKKPVIASNVDGIPTYVKDGYNGLLFKSENIDDLAGKLKLLLDDEEYRNQLAENGYSYVYENLSEQCYINKYKDFIDKVLIG